MKDIQIQKMPTNVYIARVNGKLVKNYRTCPVSVATFATEEEAEAWIAKRSFYSNNIVMDDGIVYDPKTRTVYNPDKK